MAFYDKVKDAVSFALNSIKGESIQVAKMRGYELVLDMTLKKSHMTEKSLNAMVDAIKMKLPSFRRYYKKKAELLNRKNGLPYHDLFAPMGNYNKQYTVEEAKELIINSFARFSPKMADFAIKVFDEGWADIEPRLGKTGVPFCVPVHSVDESRVMTSFDGTLRQIITLAHEIGHAYHNESIKGASPLQTSYPMPLAETASIFCETLVKASVYAEASNDAAFFLIVQELQNSFMAAIDMTGRFIFESNLMKKREDGPLSVEELKALIVESQKEVYGDAMDPNRMHPFMWVGPPHYYSADVHFYNFPYTFGILMAKGLYAESVVKGKSFIKAYDNFLEATPKMNITEAAASVGIDIETPAF